MKNKGKRHADHLAMNRKAGYKSNVNGSPKGPTKIPGDNYGHVRPSTTKGTICFPKV